MILGLARQAAPGDAQTLHVRAQFRQRAFIDKAGQVIGLVGQQFAALALAVKQLGELVLGRFQRGSPGQPRNRRQGPPQVGLVVAFHIPKARQHGRVERLGQKPSQQRIKTRPQHLFLGWLRLLANTAGHAVAGIGYPDAAISGIAKFAP